MIETRLQPGGVQNPFRDEKEREGVFRAKFLEVLTVEDMVAIFQKLIEKAKGGSVQAAKMVFGFVWGKPGYGGRLGEPGLNLPEGRFGPAPDADNSPGAKVRATGSVSVEEVFREPLRPEELREARADLERTRTKNLNGGNGPPRR